MAKGDSGRGIRSWWGFVRDEEREGGGGGLNEEQEVVEIWICY